MPALPLSAAGHPPHRWSLVVRGILAIIAAVLLLWLPVAGLVALVIIFAALCAADGVVDIFLGLAHLRRDSRWWLAVIQGLVSLGLAAVAYFWPGITLIALVWLAAAWAIWQGITEMMVARVMPHGGWLALAGLLSLALGVAMFVLPGLGLIGLVAIIAGYAFIRGVTLLAVAAGARTPVAAV